MLNSWKKKRDIFSVLDTPLSVFGARSAGAAPAPPKNLTTPHLSRARPLSGVTEILGGCGGGRPAALSGARTPGLALKDNLFLGGSGLEIWPKLPLPRKSKKQWQKLRLYAVYQKNSFFPKSATAAFLANTQNDLKQLANLTEMSLF